MNKKKTRKRWTIIIFALVIVTSLFFAYTGVYYHAEPEALDALITDDIVEVTETDYGWFFDGPSEDDLLVFLPGGKVEETAYAPLLHLLASGGMDVCLVKVPFRLAVLSPNKAGEVLDQYDYEHEFIGGHSLGGAIAASYASKHGDQLSGLILLAAYATKPLDDELMVLSIYGSEDGVLNMKKVSEGRELAPDNYDEFVIEGGNHAQFGEYGEQKGDGEASISDDKQQRLTAEYILSELNSEDIMNTVEGNFRTYQEMKDGTWKCGGYTYRYRLEITGRMPNAAKDSTFVYLSNLEEISFDQAWKAAGLSSDSNDYFSPEDAVLVEMY